MRILITGGAGFIGTNLAIMATAKGHAVVILDNFSKAGSRENWAFIQRATRTELIEEDITLPLSIHGNVDCIVHLAANVDTRKAFEDPQMDLMVNGLGSLNILEYARRNGKIPVIYASTCKVYSTAVNDLPILESESRYSFATVDGVVESFAIDGRGRHAHAPYGCSKYVGDMYMQEYHLLFDVPVVINRLSTIYGPHQHATVGYGWIDWFTMAVKRDMQITVYGNGKQVRDALHVDDLCRLLLMELESIDKHKGQIYNVGGGSANTISLLELIAMLVEMKGSSLGHPIHYQDERPADFKVYVTDITKAKRNVGWRPTISIEEGIKQLWKEF
ncbi:MAG: GDP-mannose 4,6-dehydratase [Chloroflexi bacterium]|nr:GDP-mannose 4,6-dehydratase [Chloroflexota bacterium]